MLIDKKVNELAEWAKGKPLGFHPRFTFENFISVPTNKSAFDKCVEFAKSDSPASNPILLYGPTAVGKTHLLHAIGNYVANSRQEPKIAMAQTETFCAEMIESLRQESLGNFRDKYRNYNLLILDDIQFVVRKERTQIEFFHIFKNLLSNKVKIALAASRPSGDIQPLWRLLQSKLGMGLMVPLEMCIEKELYSILSNQRENYSSTKPPIPGKLIKLICQEPGIDFRRAEGCMIRLGALYSASGKYPSATQWARWLCSTRRSSLGQNRIPS
jgi:chromosomal replication initiator protein